MPIYEYQCQECGHHSEELQRVSDPPLTTCPDCGGPYKKLISAPAFQFKGSGWYVTDYARKQGGETKKEAADGGDGGAGKGEGAEAKAEKGSASREGGGKAAGGKAEKSEKAARGGKAESAR